MLPAAATPRDSLILRLLLQVIRPQRLRMAVHRRIALLTVVPYCYAPGAGPTSRPDTLLIVRFLMSSLSLPTSYRFHVGFTRHFY